MILKEPSETAVIVTKEKHFLHYSANTNRSVLAQIFYFQLLNSPLQDGSSYYDECLTNSLVV